MCPKRPILHFVSLLPEETKKVLELAVDLPKGVAFEIEEEVARRWCGKQAEPPSCLRWQQVIEQSASFTSRLLESRLVAELLECGRREAQNGHAGHSGCEFAEFFDAGRREAIDLIATDSGDADEVVHCVPVRFAQRPKVAETAVFDRVRLGPSLSSGGFKKAATHAPVVGSKVGDSKTPVTPIYCSPKRAAVS